jgi:hypothetical protein
MKYPWTCVVDAGPGLEVPGFRGDIDQSGRCRARQPADAARGKPSVPGHSPVEAAATVKQTARASGLPVNADSPHCHLLKQVRRGYGGGWVTCEGSLKLGIAKCVPECCHRLPDRVVEEHAAASDPAVQLG